MKRITMFSFGYWGWGGSTEYLVQSIDSVERSRGFKPPLFVDIRISRAVRATGFNGNAFGEILGERRHFWMNRLGNLRIVKRTGRRIQIKDPSAANDLLDVAMNAAADNRRVIFFCGCMWPCYCHRSQVAGLLRKIATKRKVKIETVEWPGGKPQHFDLAVHGDLFEELSNGRRSIPVGHPRLLASWAEVPVGSIVTVRSGEDILQRITGPIQWHRDEWELPIVLYRLDGSTSLTVYRREADVMRRKLGLLSTKSV